MYPSCSFSSPAIIWVSIKPFVCVKKENPENYWWGPLASLPPPVCYGTALWEDFFLGTLLKGCFIITALCLFFYVLPSSTKLHQNMNSLKRYLIALQTLEYTSVCCFREWGTIILWSPSNTPFPYPLKVLWCFQWVEKGCKK